MRIGIAYNLKEKENLHAPANAQRLSDEADEEFDDPETIRSIQGVLAEEGHDVYPLGGDLGIIEKIRELKIDFVFNIAEGRSGRSREAHVPAVLEMLEVPYSGSDPLALALTLDKALTKQIALSLSIPTPEFWVLTNNRHCEEAYCRGGVSPPKFGRGNRAPTISLACNDGEALFIKPLWQGSSKGIRLSSCVRNGEELQRELHRLFSDYPEEPVLVERYIPGREVTVGLIGGKPEVLGAMEIAFRDPSKTDFCYSLEVKRNWKALVDYRVPPAAAPETVAEIEKAAVRLFKALRLRDVARLDFRVSRQNEFYFLEVNPLPGLSPSSGDLAILAQKKGWSFRDLILTITRSAFSRYPELMERQVLYANRIRRSRPDGVEYGRTAARGRSRGRRFQSQPGARQGRRKKRGGRRLFA